MPKWAVADRGYTSSAFRRHIRDRGCPAWLRREAPFACPDWIYNNRNWLVRLWARLKEWRAVATRYEKTATSFLGVLSLGAAIEQAPEPGEVTADRQETIEAVGKRRFVLPFR